MDEAPPYPWDARRAAPLVGVLSGSSRALLAVASGGAERVFRFYIARQRFDAYLLADRLKQAGIRAHVFNEHTSSIVGEVPPEIAQPQVWLERETDRERARDAVANDGGRRRAAGTRHCVQCGEESPAKFDLCWKCGAAI